MSLIEFRWNDWNEEHIGAHGISPQEVESVIRGARRPYPRRIEEDKWLVWGTRRGGRLIQAIFVMDEDDAAYVIHARTLTEQEKRRHRRRQRR